VPIGTNTRDAASRARMGRSDSERMTPPFFLFVSIHRRVVRMQSSCVYLVNFKLLSSMNPIYTGGHRGVSVSRGEFRNLRKPGLLSNAAQKPSTQPDTGIGWSFPKGSGRSAS
jgi:hypothetical protein